MTESVYGPQTIDYVVSWLQYTYKDNRGEHGPQTRDYMWWVTSDSMW